MTRHPRTRRRAFTLIELAGVLVVLSFLAVQYLRVATDARAKAEAAVIVANLQTMKSAAAVHFQLAGGVVPGEDGHSVLSIEALQPYIGVLLRQYGLTEEEHFKVIEDEIKEEHFLLGKEYFLYVIGPAVNPAMPYHTHKLALFVVRNVSDQYTTYPVRRRLEEIAESAGLYNGNYIRHTGEIALDTGVPSYAESLFEARRALPEDDNTQEPNRYLVMRAL